jgi:hypothetical protein
MKNNKLYRISICVSLVFLTFNIFACNPSSDIEEDDCLYSNTCDLRATEGSNGDVEKTRDTNP